MNSPAYSRQQEEGDARTGMAQKDVKSRRRSVMDIFHDSLHNGSSRGGHFTGGSDHFPSNDVLLDPLSRGFSTHPDPMDEGAPPCNIVEERHSSKPPRKPADHRKEAAGSVNPWGLIFKNRDHFVEIHLR